MPTTFTRFPSALGELVLTASDTALRGVFFPVRRNRSAPEEQSGWVEDDGRGLTGALLARVRRQLTEYFEGTRTTFDLPLDATGSAFEHRVWNLLRAIPYGATTNYGELARCLGDPRATRAASSRGSAAVWTASAGCSSTRARCCDWAQRSANQLTPGASPGMPLARSPACPSNASRGAPIPTAP